MKFSKNSLVFWHSQHSFFKISPTVDLPIPNLPLRAISVGLGTDSAYLVDSILFSNDNSILWRFAGLSDMVMFATSCVFASEFTRNWTVC